MGCKYSNLLGEPNKGVHATRISLFGKSFALYDILGTIIGSYILSRYLKKDFWTTLLFVFIAGIILHKLFCVDTTLNKMLFGPSS